MPRHEADLFALGAFLRERRQQLALTQSQLAERVGWTQERISLLENGKYGIPSVPALVRLASALDVSVATLLEMLGYPSGRWEGSSARDEEGSVALYYTMQRLLAIEALTLQEALAEASDVMGTAMGADKIDAFMYDPPTGSLVALGTSNTPLGALQHQAGLDRFPLANQERTAQVYQTGEAYYTGDAQSDPDVARGVKESLGVQSLLLVPLRVDGAVQGVLSAASREPDHFSEEDQQFFATAARWVGMIAHRAELSEARRQTLVAATRHEVADEVIEALAHDLGNMLTPLKGRLELLQRRLARAGAGQELGHAQEAARSVAGMQQLVGRLLDVSRLDHGLFALSLQPVDLAALVHDVAAELRPTWTHLVIRLGDIPPVEGDPVRLREVLTNLVTNAIQHSPDGAPVCLGGGEEQREDGPWVILSVTDEGPGVPPEMVPHLFERFARGRGARGMGLGLYLSRRLVEAHGGTLTVDTDTSRGTTFRLALPAREG